MSVYGSEPCDLCDVEVPIVERSYHRIKLDCRTPKNIGGGRLRTFVCDRCYMTLKFTPDKFMAFLRACQTETPTA